MSSAENGRLVWLDDELFDWIVQYAGSQRPVPTGLLILIGKREGAPADPAEAVRTAVELFGGIWISDTVARHVLAALGVPAPPQRPTPKEDA